MSAIVLDGQSLGLRAVAAVADGARVSVPGAVLDALTRQHAQAAASTRPVYGRSTGVGANREVSLAGDRDDAARSLVRSHALLAGPLRSRRRVRAMLCVRINQLAAGRSGISPTIVSALIDTLNSDRLPEVGELGSIGTGDLPQLAAVGLALADGGSVRIAATDALPLLSSNAATVADAALALDALDGPAAVALQIAAATVHAVHGNTEAFAAQVEAITPFPGAIRVCRRLRALTVDAPDAARIQDPFALRCLPQVHGPLLDALATTSEVVLRLVNAAPENPSFHGADVVHHGGFHQGYLGQSLDALRSALAQAARGSTGRLALLCNLAYTDCPPFLGDGTPGASGVMMLEYVAASAAAQLTSLAAPTGLGSVSISLGVEDDASFASQAAAQTLATLGPLRTVLAAELLAAVRCLRLRDQQPRSLGPLLDACAALPAEFGDQELSGQLRAADQILDALAQVPTADSSS